MIGRFSVVSVFFRSNVVNKSCKYIFKKEQMLIQERANVYSIKMRCLYDKFQTLIVYKVKSIQINTYKYI